MFESENVIDLVSWYETAAYEIAGLKTELLDSSTVEGNVSKPY